MSFLFYARCSLKCSATGEPASDEDLTDSGDKLILGDVVKVPPVIAVDEKGSSVCTPDMDESNCLNVGL